MTTNNRNFSLTTAEQKHAASETFELACKKAFEDCGYHEDTILSKEIIDEVIELIDK